MAGLRASGQGPLGAMCGRLPLGKAFLTSARLVGAAMCSTCGAAHVTAGHNAFREDRSRPEARARSAWRRMGFPIFRFRPAGCVSLNLPFPSCWTPKRRTFMPPEAEVRDSFLRWSWPPTPCARSCWPTPRWRPSSDALQAIARAMACEFHAVGRIERTPAPLPPAIAASSVTLLGDAAQPLLASAGVLLRHKADPG